MYITSARLSDLLEWFHSSTRFQFLLLFAAGDSKTAAFIGSLFDQKETIDIVSSSEVAVFLFAPKIESVISFFLDGGPNAFLQGVRLDPKLKRRTQLTQLPAETVSIQSITDANYKEKIVRASVTATHDLTSELGLGPKDIPAWILFHRNSDEPLVVRTKGQDEVGQLLEFLKDLRQIDFKRLESPRAAATSRRQRLRQSRLHLQDAEQQLEDALGQWRQRVDAAGTKEPALVSSAVRPENAIDVLKWPGSGDLAVRNIVRQWQRYQSAAKSVAKLEMEIRNFTDAIDSAPLALSHNEREVARIVQKYQTLFQLRLIGAKLSTFVRVVTGAGKQAQEMTDIVGKLRKALGDDA